METLRIDLFEAVGLFYVDTVRLRNWLLVIHYGVKNSKSEIGRVGGPNENCITTVTYNK